MVSLVSNTFVRGFTTFSKTYHLKKTSDYIYNLEFTYRSTAMVVSKPNQKQYGNGPCPSL